MSINEKMTAIANAIRNKTYGTEPLTLDDMATEIPVVYDRGVADGKKANYDEFWDNYQKEGSLRTYIRVFSGSSWDDTCFNPKYPIIVGNSYACFHSNEALTKIHVTLDLSQATGVTQMFYGCTNLVTFKKLIVSETTPFNANTFQSCSSLQNLNLEGVIGVNGLDLHWSTKLTHDSLMQIINALKNYSSSGTTYTVTLGATNLAKLTADERAIAEQKGWTLA